ncbi:hypothetical protein [Streptomyces cavernicola]|uniref:DUF4272 domain-containing protein n=1 Tax=Streptomyces cavernicola TaxID=3043613 RepID=A0ABT6S2S8_9ACTN|nr:hypothetical protein [Streptomyces sp. B-S-A6]MDI3402330.1 hypothetical protein [Streptomyces sp. B-S-A6]
MITFPDDRTAELHAAWSQVRADTPAAEAEPLVLDCARRLSADPGGEAAFVWVAGLVEMVEYLAWRPGAAARAAAVAALLAAASALGERECGHELHPYEEELALLDESELFWRPSVAYLLGEPADRPRQEADLCPGNVAGHARLAADAIEPFGVDGIPARVPEEHVEGVAELTDFLHDYPSCDPGPTIEINARGLSDRPTRGALAGFVLTQHVSCWYVIHRITARPVFDEMIEGLEQALGLLPPASDCVHGEGEHPDPEERHYETDAQLGFYLRSPGGRAEARGFLEDDGPMDAWVCPAFLREQAEEALGELRGRHEELFAVRDTSALDAAYLTPEGALDIGGLTRALVHDPFDSAGGAVAQNVGLWAARRHATAVDPHVRLVLLHLALWVGAGLDLPYGPGREVRALLRRVGDEVSERGCTHRADEHPDRRRFRGGYQAEKFKQHLDHLYAPATHPAPADAYPAEVWSCPGLLGQWAGESVAELDEAYFEMDLEDGDELSTLL